MIEINGTFDTGFELGCDYWGTIFPFSYYFGGHFYFWGGRQIDFYSTFFLDSYREANKMIFFTWSL